MTQNEQVLKHLMVYGKITRLEAIEKYGILRLGARVWDLKKQGYPIKAYLRSGVARSGEGMVYAEYRMERLDDARRLWE